MALPRGAAAPALGRVASAGVRLHEDEEGPIRSPQHLCKGQPRLSPPLQDGTGQAGEERCACCMWWGPVAGRRGVVRLPNIRWAGLCGWGGGCSLLYSPAPSPWPWVHCGCPHWLSALMAKVGTSQHPLPVLSPNLQTPQRLLPCLPLRTLCVFPESHVKSHPWCDGVRNWALRKR